MSQSTAVRAVRPGARPGYAPAPTPARGIPRPPAPRLRVVDVPAHTRSRAGLVVGCVGLLALGLVTLLLLNVSLERGAYELSHQRALTAQLTDAKQALQEDLAARQAPDALAAKAAALGMVPAPNAVFLRRSDGTVLGVPSQAVATRAPSVSSSATGASPSAAAATPQASKPSATGSTKAAAGAAAASKAATPTATKPGTAAPAKTGTTTRSGATPAPTSTAR